MHACVGPNVLPASVLECVSESTLQRAFLQCLEGQQDLCWTLTRPVTVGFYRDIHRYLRQWPPAQSATNATFGCFYLLIDVNFRSRRMAKRPDNIYMFVQKIADSDRLSSDPMYYGVDSTVKQLQSAMCGYQEDLEAMSHEVSKHQEALKTVTKQLEVANTDLASTRRALSDVSNQLQKTAKQRDVAHKQACKMQDKLESAYLDSVYYEDEIQSKNNQLSDLVKSLRSERKLQPVVGSDDGNEHFCFETLDGGHIYTTAVRELYYKLLADQLPPAKISSTIRSILKSFLPSLDVDKLRLPSESCASYMRREELTTVNLAHNATSLLQSSSLNLNCDGTTLSQKKLQGAAINDTVLSVNELPDGSAESMITDISNELQKLRGYCSRVKFTQCGQNKLDSHCIIQLRLCFNTEAI